MRKMWPWLIRLAWIALVALFTACPNPNLDGDVAPRGAVEIHLSAVSPPGEILDGAWTLSIISTESLGGLEEERIDAVWVRILSVELWDVDAETWLTVADFGPEGKEWELLALTQNLDSLGLRELEPGLYGQIRLILSGEHRVIVDGVEHPLRVPSGERTGIKLVGDFEIAAAGLTRISVDFVADESVHKTGAGEYLLKPVIKIKEVVTTPFLVDEDFEAYAIGAYPSNWGWYPLWSGTGVARAVEAPAFAGKRAFQQEGYTNWVRSDGIDLDLSSRDRLSYGAALMVPSGSPTGGHIGFFKRTQPNESIEFNSLALNPGSEIMALGTAWVGTGVLCQADTWYELRVDLDYAHGHMDVWLDGAQVLDDVPARGRDESHTFFTGSGWTNTVAGISTLYVDALRIY